MPRIKKKWTNLSQRKKEKITLAEERPSEESIASLATRRTKALDDHRLLVQNKISLDEEHIKNLKSLETLKAALLKMEETDKKEIETDSEQKMDVDVKKEPLENGEGNEEFKPPEVPKAEKKDDALIKIIPKTADLAYLLTVDEADLASVEGDESITMTAEEVRSYIEKSVFEHIINNNPVDVINSNSGDLMQRMKAHRDEFQKLAKLIAVIEKDQVKFLRTDKKLRMSFTKTGGVGVDLPVLASSIPDDTILKKGFVSHTFNNNSNTTTKIITASSTPKVAAPSSTAGKAQKSGADIECIDLTDESVTPTEPVKKNQSAYSFLGLVKHPAPLPPKPFTATNVHLPPIPPKPRLKISSEDRGIVLQWDMMPNTPDNRNYAPLTSFDIFGYQEQKSVPINTLLWKKIGSVKAMNLPMACTLTQFIEGFKYHFAVRAMDMHNRYGFYSEPISITYNQKK